VTMSLYEDFRCPHCADFEETLGSTITDLQRDKTIKVELYPMSFVDPEHGSVSAANAVACAATAGRGQQYYAGLFQNYPLEWTNERLIKLGELVGLTSADFRTCVTGQQHRRWVDSINKAAAGRGVDSTPTVFINGQLQKDADTWKPDQLKAAVEAAS
jgi:protein-disulfide isomerase